ncbi:MAG TPA: BrxE family protein [Phycisphaerae bacterium]|jgi:hypothetical protein|nr:BrxE family protein [Phycisphaerae bacterium]
MDADQIKQLARLRLAVGYLGEQAEMGWWSSTFCGKSGTAFLAPVFPRTHALAQYHGATAAAARVHDDRIGVGDVYHLFRLPEDLEQSLHAVGRIDDLATSVHTAMGFLSAYAENERNDAVGPVNVGGLASLRDSSRWKLVAACYLSGFEQQRETFPFFSDRK